MSDWDWTVPMQCDRCGRDIFVPEKKSWAYKKTPGSEQMGMTNSKTLYFCSWGCMRKYEAETGNGMKRHIRARA